MLMPCLSFSGKMLQDACNVFQNSNDNFEMGHKACSMVKFPLKKKKKKETLIQCYVIKSVLFSPSIKIFLTLNDALLCGMIPFFRAKSKNIALIIMCRAYCVPHPLIHSWITATTMQV